MIDRYTLLQKIGIYAALAVFLTFILLPFFWIAVCCALIIAFWINRTFASMRKPQKLMRVSASPAATAMSASTIMISMTVKAGRETRGRGITQLTIGTRVALRGELP